MNEQGETRTRLVDLSLKTGIGMPVYPGDPLFTRKTVINHEDDGYQVSLLTLGTHLGTHLDAPRHAFVDGETIDELPLDLFWGPAAVLDLTPLLQKEESDRPAVIDQPDLLPFKPIFEEYDRILLRTDWGDHFYQADYYTSFPSLTTDAAEWLAEFPFRLLGLESPSLSSLSPEISGCWHDEDERSNDNSAELDSNFLDEILDGDRECHRIFLGRTPPVILLEGLTNLKELPAFTYRRTKAGKTDRTFIDPKSALPVELCCYPLCLEGGDGCPVRVIARWGGGVTVYPTATSLKLYS